MLFILFDFFKSRALWVNLLALLIFLIIGIGATVFALDRYTRQGESITVPDFKGMTIEQLDEYIKNKPLRYKISDSSYVNGKLPESILEQKPIPGEKVKRNRRIYLTINSKVPPITALPDLYSSSLKNAKIQLANAGLVLGETTYKPCIGNTVEQMSIKGENVKKGKKISKGTKVDLVLCDGVGNRRIEVPDLVGYSYNEAVTSLRLSELSLGAVRLDEGLGDKEGGFVYRQWPVGNGHNTINIGEPIDLYLQKEPVMTADDLQFDFDNNSPGQVINFNKIPAVDSAAAKNGTPKVDKPAPTPNDSQAPTDTTKGKTQNP